MDLTEAIHLVAADLRRQDARREDVPDRDLIDFARDDIPEAEIAAALIAREITVDTVAAYLLVWAATPADIRDALLAAAR